MYKYNPSFIGKGAVFQRVLPLLGHALKGEEKPQHGNAPGKNIQNAFRVTLTSVGNSLTPETHQSILAALQEQFHIQDIRKEYIEKLPISFAFADPYDNMWVGKDETTGKKAQLLHECQHIPHGMKTLFQPQDQNKSVLLYEVLFDSNNQKSTQYYPFSQYEPSQVVFCSKTSCKSIIMMRFHIRGNGLENYGVFGFSTHSRYDIDHLSSQILYYDDLLRKHGFLQGIQHVPLIFERVQDRITKTTQKTGTFRGEEWLVNLRFDTQFLTLFPVFSTPPILQPHTSQDGIRAKISPHVLTEVQRFQQDDRVAEQIRNYITSFLRTGVFCVNNMFYPVTTEWVVEKVLPRIYKHIQEQEQITLDSQEKESSQGSQQSA